MRSRTALLTASSCALLLAGCGGGSQKAAPQPRPPRLPADIATQLASDADRVATASPTGCSARDAAVELQSDAIAAIQSRRVPGRYQETLLGTVNDLAVRLSECGPEPEQGDRGNGHGDQHGKKKGWTKKGRDH